MADPIEITRYPNRRLYDRSAGQYVTLQELEDKIRQGHDIAVRDSKTGEDLTRSILTQMLLERYPERMDLIPVSFLHHMLRANDLALDWLRTSLRQFWTYFESLPIPMTAPPTSTSTSGAAPEGSHAARPASGMAPGIAPLEWFAPMLAPFGWTAPPSIAAGQSATPATPASPAGSPTPEELAERVEQLERRLRELEAERGDAPSAE